MTIEAGAIVRFDVEKPAAGGRMLARHEGRVVLIAGAIPGERVVARVERLAKGMAYADTLDVETPSPDRREAAFDGRCGGNVLAHVRYERQCALKAEILQDAFTRLARLPLPTLPLVIPSPETGYRMRARLHVHGSRIGFYREGSHQLCDAARTGQLSPPAIEWIELAQRALHDGSGADVAAVELAENVPASELACHLELQTDTTSLPEAITAGLVGLSTSVGVRGAVRVAHGVPVVGDVLHLSGGSGPALRLRRGVRAFFQGNRFLLERLVHEVIALVPDGPVLDLYAGVGLFGLSLAARGSGPVTLVEGDATSATDLEGNAEPFARVRVARASVEAYLRSTRLASGTTAIVDPPRTGLSRDALRGLVEQGVAHLVYVSCDVATLARDTRTLLDAGYELERLFALDLFPGTAHVESIAVYRGTVRRAGP